MTLRPTITRLPTGVLGLDAVLGGGLPELSFNLIAGPPGCGKTTLAHQLVFANATDERPALYFTVIGEPPVKMLRYQQQFSFFDPNKLERAIRFVHLGDEMDARGLDGVLDRIARELASSRARYVVVDSFRSLSRPTAGERETSEPALQLSLQRFIQSLALLLTSREATTFLVSEYLESELNTNPVFTVADGIVWMSQTTVRNSVVRRLQIMKVRGQAELPGLHTLKIADDGIRVFPRIPPPAFRGPRPRDAARRKTGIAGLDEMLHGGIPAGDSVVIVGPSGTGKSTVGVHFVLEGHARGERAVIAVFEKGPDEWVRGAARRDELDALIAARAVELVYVRPLDLSVDEALAEIQSAVERTGATRVLIDSISGLELALAPAYHDDLRESLYRMLAALTEIGATVMMTLGMTASFTQLSLGPPGFAFLTDGIILQQYMELDGLLDRAMCVVKLRASRHSHDFRRYQITDQGIVMGESLAGYHGILRGAPKRPRVRSR